MARGDKTTKRSRRPSPGIYEVRPFVHRKKKDNDDPWKIRPEESCGTLSLLGAISLGSVVYPSEGKDCTHCVHLWSNGSKQCCQCEKFWDTPRKIKQLQAELDETGLI